MKTALVAVLVLLMPMTAIAGKDKSSQPIPFPIQIAQAKTVFLTNAGCSEVAFDALNSVLKMWGHYELVDSPDKADIVISLQARPEMVYLIMVPIIANGVTTYTPVQYIDSQVKMSVLDAKTKDELWSTTDHSKLALRKINRKKEADKSAKRLVGELKLGLR